jgi:crotonobetainyl-CoA:carnitine CoA-transferase CaiB-like acyl-CoA transferase
LIRPLDGVTVVTIEQAVAVPFATRQLADLGARVIKIERPGVGDFARGYDRATKGLSSNFVWLNRSKESLTLDLKQPEAKEVLARLLAKADVFAQNLAPGAAERLGLGAEPLRSAHPRLIVCDVSGYGSTGPYRDRKAYDLLIQAESGLLSINGTEAESAKVPISVADIAAGMYAYSGVLTALFMRERTGAGTAIEVSMLEALGEWMGYPMYYTSDGVRPFPRSGARHAAIAPYGPFAGADGEVVFLGVQSEREWKIFCEVVLHKADLAGDARFDANAKRVANLAALYDEINAVFEQLSSDAIVALLEKAGIAYARLNSVQQFAAHAQLQARDRWAEVGSPVGPLPAMLPPVTMTGVSPRMDPIPDVGQHTEAILDELGYASDTIGGWREAGMV